MKKFNEFFELNEKYTFNFQDWADTDLDGAGMEMAIDDLIDETKKIIDSSVKKEAAGMGANVEDAKKQAAKAVKELWIEKINRDLKF